MGLTMHKILNKFNDCNIFSLTGNALDYHISEDEFINALNKIKQKDKQELKEIYISNKEKLEKYPDFEILYNEIEQECHEFNSEENREYYLNKHFNKKEITKFKKLGFSDQKINHMKQDFFHCSFIADRVGQTTKYGKENRGLFYNFYTRISMNIDREQLKEKYCNLDKTSPLEQIPNELKNHLLYYEISFYNSVTVSGGLMINYYFKLNQPTKEYLLQFRNDFELNELDDLTLYKDKEEKFYSCTHEGFNSIEFDYQDMNNNELVDFINDEYPNEENNQIIDIINLLIKMEKNAKFSFKELGIKNEIVMNKICSICDKIKLYLVSTNNKEHNWATVNTDGGFDKVPELPAILCGVKDIIEKK